MPRGSSTHVTEKVAWFKINAMHSIRTGLQRIMGDFLKTQPPEEAAVLAWPVVCGAEVASRTKALGFADGRLTIQVPDANWRTQLAAFTPRYLSSLDELLPQLIKEVSFEIEKPGAVSQNPKASA